MPQDSIQGLAPTSGMELREETRMLGAIQMMTGISLHCLGLLWVNLLVSQLMVFEASFLPITTLLGYPFWSACIFSVSGFFAVLAERTGSRIVLTYAIATHIISAIVASIGVLIIVFELFLVSFGVRRHLWVHTCGKLLSEYLLLFTLLELLVSIKVTRWTRSARR
ncbi:high affinity immunoglobulin epsilon receptor subunit beta-like [Ochotona curzoniae]|uniref:high affinity immunoglobulin epsilon receptor subunit beta-like n=1 Tax=Ochotona curzoniae TaxID=130825 RepID=UPI001B3530AF|nr:high affinity immunoglobulin epsilon receptor subunit beta-like [Ochotona curzoniae]XP_040860159.1 high affinity immunoglobulin epsilon receptor subunit beta-like [Ochotona curzoniae]